MCTRPLIRAETYKTYINQKGGISYEAVFLPRGRTLEEEDYDYLVKIGKYRRVNKIPCGQCIECKLNYSREWATRAMLEKQYWPEEQCWFLTLTYDDEHLPFHETLDLGTGEIYTGASLQKEDLQNFWKNVRYHYQEKIKKFCNKNNIEYTDEMKFKCKYLNAGEYGKQTQRPHYHALVYGLPLDHTKLELWSRNEQNQPVWRCKELEEIWKKGNVMVGQLSWESAAYVARYTLKKAYGINKEYDQLQGRIPEYISMSQGIAKKYFQENMKKIYETDSVPVKNKKTGQVVKPPRSFDRILKDVDPDLYDTIKKKREITGETNQIAMLQNTSLGVEEYRQQHNWIKKTSFKDIRKEC